MVISTSPVFFTNTVRGGEISTPIAFELWLSLGLSARHHAFRDDVGGLAVLGVGGGGEKWQCGKGGTTDRSHS